MAIAPQDILAKTINSAYEANLGRPADFSGMTHYLREIASGNKTVDQVIADLEYAGQQFSQPGQAEYIAPDAVYYEAPDVSQQQYIDTRIQQQQEQPEVEREQPEVEQAPVTVTSESSFEDRVENLTSELKNMYGVVTEFEPRASYRGRESDLDKIFGNQAKKLAEKGVSSLAQLTERKDENGKRFLVNKETDETLFRITKDRDTGADKWGDVFSGVKDGANFGIQFDSEGRAVLFPVHEKTKSIGQQLLGRELNAFIEPIAVIVGAYYGGVPGAAIGSAFGQYAATGEIDAKRVAMAAATTYISTEFGSADYATKVGNTVLPAELANTATAKIVGNSVINSGVSGLIAVATGGNVEQSMITGAIVGGAIASAPDIANTLMGGESNVQAIADATNLSLRQAQDIIASSIADAVVADAQDRDGFGSALGASLVARGASTAAANKAVEFVGNNLTKNPQALAVVFNGTKGFAEVATNAAVRGQDVGDALKAAGPGIVLQAGLSGLERPQTESDRIAAILEDQLQTGGLSGEGVQVAGGEGVSGLFAPPDELQAEITNTEDALRNAQDALELMPDLSDADRSDLQRFISETQDYLGGLYNQVAGASSGIDLRQFTSEAGGQGYAIIGGGGFGQTRSGLPFNLLGTDDRGNQKFNIGGEGFTLIVLPNNDRVFASDTSALVFYPDVIDNNVVLTPTSINEVQRNIDLRQFTSDVEQPEPRPKPAPLRPGEKAEDEEGATGAEGAEGASGTPGGATPGTLQEALRFELNLLESRLQDTAKEREQVENNLARALEQQDRLREQGVLTALGPDLQEMLDAEIATLKEQMDALSATESSLGTRISDIGASQQESDISRPSNEVLGDLVRGGSGTGLPSDEGAGTGGLGGGEGPGAGEEGEGPGAGVEGEGPGSGEEGVGPGAGEEGEGPGGGGDDGEGGAGEDISPLRPVTIFDSPDGRPATPFSSRVTGEGLASILGAKEPLFGGDPDEQRAVWNRRSLRLRRALGL
jgi:hypothetical protein